MEKIKVFIIVFLVIICLGSTSDTYLTAPKGVLKIRELWVNGVKYTPVASLPANPTFNSIVLKYSDTISTGTTQYPMNTIILMKNNSLWLKISPIGKKNWVRL